MNEIFKGDTFKLEITVNDDITDWKIRAELFDKSGNSVQLATTNSGGSDDQIEKTTYGTNPDVFLLQFASGTTTNFDDIAYLEIEVDTGNTINGADEIYTIYRGEINLTPEKITWTSPS